MLSTSLGHDFARADSPPDCLTSVKYAQRCVASVFHCTEVYSGPSFFTWTATWQNRQSTETRPDIRYRSRSACVASRTAAARAGSEAKSGAPEELRTRACDPPWWSSSCAPYNRNIDRANRSTSGACSRGVIYESAVSFSLSFSLAFALRFSSTSTCHFSLAAVVSISISKRSVMSGVTSATST